MSFNINLDLCIEFATRSYPKILGPLMVNDYIQGLDRSRRLGAKEFLGRFQASDGYGGHRGEIAPLNQQRFLHQHSANNWDGGEEAPSISGYLHNPRDAALAFELWLQKWYLGVGRLFVLFDSLFAHIQRFKDLLAEDDPTHGLGHVDRIWNQHLEEELLTKFNHAIWRDEGQGEAHADGAVRWYRQHRRDHGPATLSEWFTQQATVYWPAPVRSTVSPGVVVTAAGVTIPADFED